MKQVLAALYLLSVFNFPAFAGDRVVTIPKLRYEFTPQYILNSSNKGGTIISFVIWLTRIDSDTRALTGKISLLPGTEGTAGPGVVTGIFIQNSGNCVQSAPASNSYVLLSTKSSADFTIPSGNSTKILVGSVHLADAVAAATTSFQPIIEIKINENYGAVVGSIASKAEFLNGGTGSCVGGNYSSYLSSGWTENNQTGTVTYDSSSPPKITSINTRGKGTTQFRADPIMILGGRAF